MENCFAKLIGEVLQFRFTLNFQNLNRIRCKNARNALQTWRDKFSKFGLRFIFKIFSMYCKKSNNMTHFFPALPFISYWPFLVTSIFQVALFPTISHFRRCKLDNTYFCQIWEKKAPLAASCRWAIGHWGINVRMHQSGRPGSGSIADNVELFLKNWPRRLCGRVSSALLVTLRGSCRAAFRKGSRAKWIAPPKKSDFYTRVHRRDFSRLFRGYRMMPNKIG